MEKLLLSWAAHGRREAAADLLGNQPVMATWQQTGWMLQTVTKDVTSASEAQESNFPYLK